MLTALFPGSFDPPTNGHINILHRISSIYESIYIVVAVNPQKTYSFSAEERRRMMVEIAAPYANVRVAVWDRLIVTFAEQVSARIIVRGVRALADFNYEFELSMINKGLNPAIETIFIPTDPQYFVLRSTAIKELARLGGDISSMVPQTVARAVIERMRTETNGL